MRILIVEDEPRIARDIAWSCKQILGKEITSIKIIQTLDEASDYLFKGRIDILLLDLNLHGKNGYELLRHAVSGSFHTIIISAHTDQAYEAFQYGVLDFLPKPFDEERLREAFNRYFNRLPRIEKSTQYLTVRKYNRNDILSVDDILYFRAANFYVDAVLKTGEVEILDKTMNRLEQILPSRFFRIHHSYIADIEQIRSFTPVKKGTSQVLLKNGAVLPLSKNRFKRLQQVLGK